MHKFNLILLLRLPNVMETLQILQKRALLQLKKLKEWHHVAASWNNTEET